MMSRSLIFLPNAAMLSKQTVDGEDARKWIGCEGDVMRANGLLRLFLCIKMKVAVSMEMMEMSDWLVRRNGRMIRIPRLTLPESHLFWGRAELSPAIKGHSPDQAQGLLQDAVTSVLYKYTDS